MGPVIQLRVDEIATVIIIFSFCFVPRVYILLESFLGPSEKELRQ